MAGQAAELRLNLALDLQFFRQQLTKAATIAASEFTPQINIKINRQTLDRELNNLQRSLGRRSYRIELQTNFKAQAEYAERIAAVGPALERAAAAFKQVNKGGLTKDLSNLLSKQELVAAKIAKVLGQAPTKGGASQAAIEALYRKAAEAGLAGISGNAGTKGQRAKELGQAFAGMAQNAVASFLSEFEKGAVKAKNSGIALGQGAIDGVKSSMEIASPSKKMKKLGSDAAEGFNIGITEGLAKVEESAAAKTRNVFNAIRQEAEIGLRRVKQVLDAVAGELATSGKTIASVDGKRLGLNNLPLMQSSAEKKSGRAAGIVSSIQDEAVLRDLYKEIRGTIQALSAMRDNVQANNRKLSGFGIIIGLAAFAGVPLAKNIQKLSFSANNFANLLDRIGDKYEDALLRAAANILRASTSNKFLPPAYRGLPSSNIAGALPPAYRGLPGSNIAGALPPAYRGLPGSRPAGALPPAYRGLPIGGFDFGGLPPGGRGSSAVQEPGKLALSNEALGRRINAILQEYFKVAEVQVREVFDLGELRKSFDIFSYIAQSLRDAESRTKQARVAESVDSLMRSIEQSIKAAEAAAQVRLAQVEVLPPRPAQPMLPGTRNAGFLPSYEPQSRLFARRERESRLRSSLQEPSPRGPIIPAAPQNIKFAPALPQGQDVLQGSTTKQALRALLISIERANVEFRQFFADNFSGNSYLPRATRDLASAMASATASLRLLTGTKAFGALPTRDMVDITRIKQAIMTAVRIDLDNALRQQMEGRMLPAAGGTSVRANLQKTMEGIAPLSAPTVGFERVKRTPEELRQDVFARREKEARERSLLRERDVRQELIQKLLPPSSLANIGGSARETLVNAFYDSLRSTQQTLNRYFSANSYLPRSTQQLAAAMQQAAQGMKALPGARGPIAALPTKEMVDATRFQQAMKAAVRIDIENALKAQQSKLYLPAAGQTSFRSPEQISQQAEQKAALEIATKAAREQASEMIRQIRADMRTPLLPPGITYPSSPIGSIGQFPTSGIAGRGSMGRFPTDPMLAVGGASAMGQKVAGPYPWSNTTRSAQGGYIPSIRSSAFFPMSGMMGPSSPLGRITAQSSMFGGGGGAPPVPPSGGGRNAVQSFGQQMMGTQIGQLPNLPGAEGVRELGAEFKYATQQLVLFGTVYKGLAFLQNFPREVMASVGALQTYRNSLQAVTGSTQAFGINNEYILGLVDKYNIPLEAARQGFVKLYASMAPAGFTGTEIRGLFEAVSQGAATFGMSSDQVDRVINSFAQMASKGQVMAEELKGQLGDVLPGAFALFAEAAGYEGPAAIAQFSKAMENGEFKGAKMRELLLNVKEVMNKEFGPGAEGAARTFQGAMNRMNTSVKLFYEAFEPLAVQFLNTFVVPISNGLRIATEGFTQFFTGVAAQSSGGKEFGAALESLRPAFEGIAANVSSLLPQFKLLGSVLLEVGKIFLQIAGNPITGFLLRTYAAILPLQIAFNVLRVGALIPLIGSFVRFIGTIPLLISNFGALISSVLAYNAATAAGVGQQAAMKAALIQTGLGAQQAAAGFRAAGIALRIFAGLATGGLLLGLGIIIERFASMKAGLDGIASAARGVSSSLASMSRAGDIAGINQLADDLGMQLKTFQEIKKYAYKPGITEKEKTRLQKLGMEKYVGKGMFGGSFINDQARFLETVNAKITETIGNLSEIPQKRLEADERKRRMDEEAEKDARKAAALAAVGGETGTGKPGKPATLDASAISGLQKDAAAILSDTISAQFDATIAKIELAIGRGAGVFEPFVDAYKKILEFNRKSSEASVDLMKLQAQGTAQEIKASNTAARNASKGLNLRTGASFAGFPVTDVPGSPRTYRNGTHEGYDIGTPIGTAISYAIGGVVKSIDKVGRGNAGKLVEVQLENGIVGLSMHLSEVLVAVGQRFQAGQIIAKTGDTGAGPAHLHQESAARAYKSGGAGASLAYLQLNGRGAAGKGGVMAPSVGEVAGMNQEQMIARQRALTAALSKDAAELYNVFAELNSADISSKINEQLFGLGESIKKVKRDTEDAAMNFLPDTAVNQVNKNIKRIERELEDLPSKYRDIEITIQRSLSGAEFSKFIGTKEFRQSDAVKKFTSELKALGVTETQVQAILDAGTQSREALAAAVNSISQATREAITEQTRLLNLELEIQKTFGNRKAILQGQANTLSAFGLPTRSIDLAQKKLSIDEDITREEYAYAQAVEDKNAGAIQRSLQQIDLLKQQKVAYKDLIPGIATYGEAVQLAFQPAVDSFYDFITGAKSAKEAFRSFAYEVVSGLAKMAAQAAIMQIFKGIFSAFGMGGLFGGGGGLFGLANGGITQGGFQAFANGGIADGGINVRAFASGGTVSGPTLGLIGEGKYNEAVVPLPDGKSIPVVMQGGGGGGEAININIAVDASGSKVQGDEGEAGKLGAAISSAVQAELIKQKRPGGLLA